MSRGPAGHEERYRAALLAFQNAAGRPPDRDWRVLLRLLTALPELWEATRGRLGLTRGTARLDPADFPFLSSSEHALLAIGLNLFSGSGTVDLKGAISCLDSVRWRIVIQALHLHREFPEDFRPFPGGRASLLSGTGRTELDRSPGRRPGRAT